MTEDSARREDLARRAVERFLADAAGQSGIDLGAFLEQHPEFLEGLRERYREVFAALESEGQVLRSSSVDTAFTTLEPWSSVTGVRLQEEADEDGEDGPDSGSGEAREPDPSVGQPVRRLNLELLGEIARGGMGIVLRAHDEDLGRDVAVKVLRRDHGENPSLLRRFVEEAQISGQLQHPGIVPIYELGLLADKRPYFAMKLVRGKTLASLLRKRESPEEDRRRFLSIFEQICQTVAYAHSRGVVHRDLKSPNVMVGAFGEVQVVDWGLAKVLGSGETPRRGGDAARTWIHTRAGRHESETGSVVGTFAYMPPEQARGESERVDERSDVFALGGILLEILTGDPTYTGDRREMLRKAAAGRLEDAHVRLHQQGVDGRLLKLARSCLEPDRDQRPAHAGQVARRIGAYLSSLEARAREAEIAAAEARVKVEEEGRARRLTRALAATVVLSIVVVGGGWLLVSQRREARVERAEALVRDTVDDMQLRASEARSAPDDPEGWSEALSTGLRVESLLESPDVGPELRQRTERSLTVLRAERDHALKEAAQRARDRVMLDRLESIRIPTDGEAGFRGSEATAIDRAFAAAFREYGIPVDGAEPWMVSDDLRESPIGPELAATIDYWAMVRRRNPELDPEAWTGLIEIAREADGDALRDQLRHHLLTRTGNRTRRILQLAEEAEQRELPRATVFLLADALDASGATKRSIELLRHAQWRHPDDFATNVRLAHALLRSDTKDWREVARLAAVAQSQRPENVAVRNLLGLAVLRGGDPQQALAHFEECIQRDPEFGPAHGNLGTALVALGELGLAASASHTARVLMPEDPRAWRNLGRILLRLGEMDDALLNCRKAVELDPESARARTALADVLSARGDPERARMEYEAAVRLEPTRAGVRVTLGRALLASGDLRSAYAQVREAIRLEPGEASHRVLLARILSREGDRSRAVAVLERALALDSSSHEAAHELALALKADRRPREARAVWEDLLLRFPTRREARLALEELRPAIEEIEAAVAELRRRTASHPDDGAAWLGLGELYEQLGEAQAAERAYRLAAGCAPENAGPHLRLADLLWRRGELADAEPALRRAAELEPRSAQSRVRLARILCRRAPVPIQRAREAVDEASAALAERPDDPDGLRALGIAYYSVGEWHECIEVLQEQAADPLADAAVLLRLAGAYHMTQRYEEVDDPYGRALEWIETRMVEDPDLESVRAEVEELIGSR